jgi:hypothetical protein
MFSKGLLWAVACRTCRSTSDATKRPLSSSDVNCDWNPYFDLCHRCIVSSNYGFLLATQLSPRSFENEDRKMNSNFPCPKTSIVLC